MAAVLLSAKGAFTELERALIRKRQHEGISFPKKDGVYKGRSRALNDDQAAEVARRAATGEAKAAVNRYVSALPAQSMTIPIASIMATFVGAPQVLADFDL
ncbi:MAG: hypothetical protein V7618_08435 [Rhodoglobus sp.]|uniref:hypothetical protein n=1 Tax=uncultured Salinibacterium sp. TaxID=459274 RepID=UPI0030D866A1|tara:strand:+ start:114875 stop:115177 length:303 start_codon:yes stop_codon:yes gene_type:complete